MFQSWKGIHQAIPLPDQSLSPTIGAAKLWSVQELKEGDGAKVPFMSIPRTAKFQLRPEPNIEQPKAYCTFFWLAKILKRMLYQLGIDFVQ